MRTRILYILSGGRQERLASTAVTPDEFFYGFAHLMKLPDVDATLRVRGGRRGPGRVAQQAGHRLLALSPDFSDSSLDGALLGQFDVIVTPHEPVHLLLALHRDRAADARLVLIEMGIDKRIASSRLPWLTRRIARWMMSRMAAVVVFGGGEADYLLQQHLVSPHKLHVVQFGVDVNYWTPAGNGEAAPGEGQVFAIGNDAGRDFVTLLKAIGSHPLRLHTRIAVPDELISPNVQLTRGDWRGQTLSDAEVRDEYRRARFVVVPLHESHQPQGQSVALQAMACGKAVVLTRTSGLWSPDHMRHGENCWLVEPGDVEGMRGAIDLLSRDRQLVARLGQAARAAAVEYFSCARMDRELEAIIRHAAANPAL
ncbi:MAG: glycosyltransferase family 4 protein [Planctomycetota bacterium]